jgi:peptidoglycan hydrolase-like protein with peptidoglycan-binding domain
VKRLVTAEKVIRQPVAAVYKDVTSSQKVNDEELKWAEVLCEDNMTAATVSDLQKLLKKAGTYNGPIDGVYGPLTERAANSYAKRNNLPTGSRLISLETAKHIGLSI